MVAYFKALKLDISDVHTLFVLLDRDREGSIDIDEFVVGCMRLRGEATSLDMAKLVLESEYTLHNVEILVDAVKALANVVQQQQQQQRMPSDDGASKTLRKSLS